MKHTSIKTLLGRSVLAAAMLALVAGSASAATYDLRAGTTTVDYGHGNFADAWGYALVSTDVPNVAADNVVRVPGPTIYVPAGEDLTINLLNNLGESTSIVIQGQKLTGGLQRNLDGRVTAFTDEAAAGAGTASYFWSAAELKTGTFLYNSGSHPAKQVHMGLYGAVVVDADPATCAPGTGAFAAYPGVCYDRDIVVIYSEVDPDLRNAAAPAQPLNFKPKYFLVNGVHTGNSVLTEATPAELNSRVLLRFVNAGLKGYVPTMLGEDLEWIAEYGNPYPHVRRSYSAYLSAGKTMDAIWVPETFDRHTLFDRRLHLSSNGLGTMGGLKAFLDSADTTLPEANAGTDQVHVPMTPSLIQLNGSSPTATNFEWALIGFPAGSTATLSDATIANPTFNIDVPGTYTAQLVVNDGTYSSAPDTVSIFTNLPPVAVATVAASAEQDDVVALSGALSYDPDADPITSYEWVVTAPDSTPIPSSGVSSSFVADQLGTYTVELTVSDGELSGSTTTYVAVSAAVVDPPTANDDYFQVIWKTADNVLAVLANDTNGDGVIVPNTVAIVTSPTSGSTAVPAGDGTILYTPRNGYKGTDYFTYEVCDDQDYCSTARVLVNVVK